MINKKIFNELFGERFSEFYIFKKIIDPENLIYQYKTEESSPKDFTNYQKPIDLLQKLRDGIGNPKEVTKSQINFK